MQKAGDIQGVELIEYSADRGRGNLLGVQPYMTPQDYASEPAFRARLEGYMQAAADRGWLGARTVVVWPEYIGTWLVGAGESPAVTGAPSVNAALRMLIVKHPFLFVWARLVSPETDKVAASVFRIKAGAMAQIYHSVFSSLAEKYAVSVVAGSILLPSPHVRDGVVTAGRGPLYNTSAVYRPDGTAEPRLVLKTMPTTDERPFIRSAPIERLPVFETPAGRLGVLICADSWYVEPYARLKAQAAELIAVPSFIPDANTWNSPWNGYDGAAPPADVDLGDVRRITEGQAWRKYALATRMKSTRARAAVNVFLRGSLWDMGLDGNSALAAEGAICAEAARGAAAILNLWL